MLLSPEDLRILAAVRDRKGELVSVGELCDLLPDIHLPDHLLYLCENGLLFQYGPVHLAVAKVRLAPSGAAALAAEEKLAKDAADKAAQDAAKEAARQAERSEDIRRNKQQFYLGHLFTFLTGVAVGLIVAWVTHLW